SYVNPLLSMTRLTLVSLSATTTHISSARSMKPFSIGIGASITMMSHFPVLFRASTVSYIFSAIYLWVMALSIPSLSGSENTMSASFFLSSSPSSPTISPPKYPTSSSKALLPADVTLFASTSASMTAAPRSFSTLATELFPLPMPPVTPIILNIIILSSHCLFYFVSYQLDPVLTSATSGTSSLTAFSMHSLSIFSTSSFSSTLVSTISSSCTWSISADIILRARSSLYTLTIAILMISAAVPWIGMFMATRSPKDRVLKLDDFSSGRYLLLP